MTLTNFVYSALAVLCAGLIAFTMTPPVRVLAFRIGAVDIPLDQRRMHKKPIPRIGGLAIFFGFTASTMIFCNPTKELFAIWLGGFVLVALGIFDDLSVRRDMVRSPICLSRWRFPSLGICSA